MNQVLPANGTSRPRESTGKRLMMVSLIQSNYTGFGSGIVVPGTGIALHNRASGFVTTKGHPNQVGPKKRPFHTIIPAFITKDGKPVATFGLMGGAMEYYDLPYHLVGLTASMHRRQEVVAIAEMVLAELPRGVALRLEQVGDGRILL